MQARTIQFLSIALFLSLLTWGLWTMFVYLGVPIHSAVLVTGEVREWLKTICADDGTFCRGMFSLFPFLWYTIIRLDFLLWYTGICVLLYAAGLVWNYVRTLQWRLSLSLRPWKLLVLFIASLWLLFTCISFINVGELSIRHLIEPTPDVYRTAGPEAMQALQANFERLQSAGCLDLVGAYGSADAYMIRGICMQGAFFVRVLPLVLVVLVLLFELLTVGRFLLRRLRCTPERLLTEAMLSVGLGIFAWTALLWLGAVFHIYTSNYAWALLFLLPALCNKDAFYWVDRFFRTSWHVERKWYSVSILLFWLLVSYLALNFINVVRPFPIGWDDLGSYLNRPRLLVSYGHFIHSMAPFQWEYLTSLGYLLFGYASDFGASSSMMINWLQGLIAVCVVYGFTNVFLGPGRGILAASLYYFLPLVGHFSYADMKIDNSVFFMGALALFTLFLFLFRPNEEEKYPRSLLVLAGIFVGLAFGFKVTAIMVALTMGAILLGVQLHWSAFVSTVFFAVALLTKQGALQMDVVVERIASVPVEHASTVAIASSLIAGVLILVLACARAGRERMRNAVLSALLLIAGFAAAVVPWIIHNNIRHGRIIPTRIELGAPNTHKPVVDPYGHHTQREGQAYFTLPPELAVDYAHETCSPTGAKEELGRYWGYRNGWGHYLTLPYRTVMNLDSVGYYVTTMPAVLLFPLLLLLPFFWRKREGQWFRWLWVGTLFLIVQWVFLAKGIPWYGIGMLLGIVISLEVLLAKAPDVFSRSLVMLLVTVSLFSCLNMRFWQFETQRNLFEYPLGKVSRDVLVERTVSHYDDIAEIVVARNKEFPDRPLLFRVGTFIPYFIPRNLEIIGATDHQLDFFNCLYQDRNPELMLERLKALGFNSIIFDTNTATIEKDPNGSLHQKVGHFVDFLNYFQNNELQVVINDTGGGVAFVLIP